MASDTKFAKPSGKTDSTKVKVLSAESTQKKPKSPNPVGGLGGYFIGAWREIKQVRWPNRSSTWRSTLAVLMFTAFWAIIVLAVDLLFQSLLNKVFS